VDVIVCARCSSPIARGDRYCPRCGAEVRLLASPASAPQAPADAAPAPSGAAQSGPEYVTLGSEPGRPHPAPAPVPARSQVIAERLASLSSEPRNELAALALTGLGGAMALASFFLPWAAANGMAIGSTSLRGEALRGGAWAFDTPAGWPLFLISLLLLAAVVAGDRLGDLLPGMAETLGVLTAVVAPLALGSGLLAVALMYLTLPWGCGGGLVLLALGACLLVAGSMVALFFPAASKPRGGRD
jgi:hypothetical protein